MNSYSSLLTLCDFVHLPFQLYIIVYIFTTILTSDDPVGKEEKRPKYLDQDKYDYIQNYLEQAREETKDGDSHSVTTDTSDSGMMGSNSASSEVGTEDTSGKHIL